MIYVIKSKNLEFSQNALEVFEKNIFVSGFYEQEEQKN